MLTGDNYDCLPVSIWFSTREHSLQIPSFPLFHSSLSVSVIFQGILAVEPGKATPNSAQIASCSLTYLFGVSKFVYTSDVLRLMAFLPFVLSNIMPNTGLQSIFTGLQSVVSRLQSVVSGLQSILTGKNSLTTRKRAT